MEYRAVETIRYSFSLFRPLEEVREEINELIFLGESYKDSKMYEEAGRIYFEVARLIEVYFRHYETAQEKFQESARCFRKIHSQTLYNVYEKILDLLVKDNTLNLALQDCFIFGYKFGAVYRDDDKREAFYKRGDQIREQHGKSHRCPKTSFTLSEYEDDVQKAFNDYDKFNIKRDLPVFGHITYTSACRKCIDVYGHLCDFIKDKQRVEDETENKDKNETRKLWEKPII